MSARPEMGKTTLLKQLAWQLDERDYWRFSRDAGEKPLAANCLLDFSQTAESLRPAASQPQLALTPVL